MRKCTVDVVVRFSESDLLNEDDERVLELTNEEKYKAEIVESLKKEICNLGNNIEIKGIHVQMKIEEVNQ